MSQISYRANLSAAIFPMTLARAGRSVIIPGPDQNFNRSIDSPDDSNRDAGIPQIIYGENILPTADGYQSVGYRFRAAWSTTGGPWSDIVVYNPANASKNIMLLIGNGIVRDVFGTLYTIVGTPPVGPGNNISTASVRGVCYLHVGTQIYTLSGTTLTNVTAIFTPAGILTSLTAICGSFNYLILLKNDGTGDVVFWSSTTTPTDFTPSLISGSSSGALTNNAGKALQLKSNPEGFYVGCIGNVVSVVYTGNLRYPWRFNALPSSQGANFVNGIAGERSDSAQIVLSGSGSIFQITPRSAELIAPEVGEFLSRFRYRDLFDYATNTFTVKDGSFGFLDGIRISYVLDRFILLSFKSDPAAITYTDAIVYDLAFKRYGRVKVNHTSIIDVATSFVLDSPYSLVLMFVNAIDGTSYTLVQNVNDFSIQMQGVLVLGKFQYVRSRFLCLDEVAVEASQLQPIISPNDRNFQAFALPTLDGKTFLPAQSLFPVADQTTGAVQTYYSSTEGKNVSLLFKGAFDICSVDMTFHIGGAN